MHMQIHTYRSRWTHTQVQQPVEYRYVQMQEVEQPVTEWVEEEVEVETTEYRWSDQVHCHVISIASSTHVPCQVIYPAPMRQRLS